LTQAGSIFRSTNSSSSTGASGTNVLYAKGKGSK
jgi:hypothetical protein